MDEIKIWPRRNGKTNVLREAERQAVIDQTVDETGRDREELDAYEYEIQEPDRD